MIEFLNNIDTNLFLYLNGLHNPFMDKVMLILSYNKRLMGLLSMIRLRLSYKTYKKKVILVFLFAGLSFGLSDSISTKVFKDQIKRLRPCKQDALASKVHLAGKKCWGGKFGFVSSHSANSFSVAMFIWLLFRRYNKHVGWFFVYSGLVAYSRIYLAKHYPLDIICGGILGIGCGLVAFKIYDFLNQKLTLHRQD